MTIWLISESSESEIKLLQKIVVKLTNRKKEEKEITRNIGCFLFFNNKLLKGSRLKKIHKSNIDAFESINSAPVGKLNPGNAILNHGYFFSKKFDEESSISEFRSKNISSYVLLIKIPPLIKDIFQSMISKIPKNEISIVILEVFGAGNVPGWLKSILAGVEKITGKAFEVGFKKSLEYNAINDSVKDVLKTTVEEYIKYNGITSFFSETDPKKLRELVEKLNHEGKLNVKVERDCLEIFFLLKKSEEALFLRNKS
eukprot:gene7855-12326_t